MSDNSSKGLMQSVAATAAPYSSSTPAQSDPQKPGWTTTEFYVAGVFPAIISLLTLFNVGHVASLQSPQAQAIVKLAGLLFAAIGAGFYARSRGHMKAGAAIGTALSQLSNSLPDAVTQISTINANAGVQASQLEPLIASSLSTIDSQFSDGQKHDLETLITEIVGDIVTNNLKRVGLNTSEVPGSPSTGSTDATPEPAQPEQPTQSPVSEPKITGNDSPAAQFMLPDPAAVAPEPTVTS